MTFFVEAIGGGVILTVVGFFTGIPFVPNVLSAFGVASVGSLVHLSILAYRSRNRGSDEDDTE